MQRRIPDYDREKGKRHNLSTIITLSRVLERGGWLSHDWRLYWGLGLCFDALIGNTDRHQENWGLIWTEDSPTARFAPYFDNGTSLGHELQPEKMQRMVRDPNEFNAYCRPWRTDMTRLIEHLVEPQRLLLFWQARESQKRSRYRVGQLVKQGGHVVLQYSVGTEMARAKEVGFQGYPAFPLKQVEHRHQVMEAFTRRLPPRTRRDFSRYLELRAIPADADISEFALLGYSGAKLPDDGFELMHPFDEPP
ncbi:HipA domain-containing protein [Marinobacter gelidimuriae]|uniref:hypothetical protein n=1 Tax=Marinobacter gelidimuriae TaxID=2739064 RepID=UPI0015A62306|nr:hypothetical protein [Marinobacter gelidimuriae]